MGIFKDFSKGADVLQNSEFMHTKSSNTKEMANEVNNFHEFEDMLTNDSF